MFILMNENLYKVTRESMLVTLEKKVKENLERIFKEKILKEFLPIVLECIQIPEIVDTNYLFVYDNNKFMEYVLFDSGGIQNTGKTYKSEDFLPTYSGAKFDEVEALIKSVKLDIFLNQNYSNVLLLNSKNDKQYALKKISDVKEGMQEILEQCFQDDICIKISNLIDKRIFKDSLIMVAFFNKNSIFFYSLEKDMSCRKVNLSVSTLSKIIMIFLPCFDYILCKVNELSIAIYNYILYGKDFDEFDLSKSYSSTVNGEGDFLPYIVVKNINFFFNKVNGKGNEYEWFSDFIEGYIEDDNDCCLKHKGFAIANLLGNERDEKKRNKILLKYQDICDKLIITSSRFTKTYALMDDLRNIECLYNGVIQRERFDKNMQYYFKLKYITKK